MHTKIVLFVAFVFYCSLSVLDSRSALADEEPDPIGPSLGEQYNFELRGFYWDASLGATMRADRGGVQGSDIDVVDDLGVDRRKGLFSGEITMEFFLRHKIRIALVSISYDSFKILDKEMVFEGETYSVNTRVNSKVDLLTTRIGYEYDFLRGDRGFLGLQLAANFVQSKASLTTDDTLANSLSMSVAIPMVIAVGKTHFGDYVSATAELGWIGYENSNLFDAVIYLDYNPLRSLGLTAGWKSIMIDAEQSGDKVDIKWSGIFAGFILRI